MSADVATAADVAVCGADSGGSVCTPPNRRPQLASGQSAISIVTAMAAIAARKGIGAWHSSKPHQHHFAHVLRRHTSALRDHANLGCHGRGFGTAPTTISASPWRLCISYMPESHFVRTVAGHEWRPPRTNHDDDGGDDDCDGEGY